MKCRREWNTGDKEYTPWSVHRGCTHGGGYTQGEYTWRDHTRRSTYGREYTNTRREHTWREHTRRSTYGREYMSEIGDDRRLWEDLKRLDWITNFTSTYKRWTGGLYLCSRRSYIGEPHWYRMEDRRRAAKFQGELHRKFSNSDSTHGEVHTEESTQKGMYARGKHKREGHKWGGVRGEEHTRSIHTQEYTRKSAHTKECIHGESTRRSKHGESAHEGVHTGRAHTGRAHMEEYTRGERTQRSTHGGAQTGRAHREEYTRRSTQGGVHIEESKFRIYSPPYGFSIHAFPVCTLLHFT